MCMRPAEACVHAWYVLLKDSLLPWEVDKLKDAKELQDAFDEKLVFGTGGIRGSMGLGPNRLNRLTIASASRALGCNLISSVGSGARLVISYDTRDHSKEFAMVAANTLGAMGCVVVMFDKPTPTPVLSFAVRHLGCSAGIAITASHNPREDNGFKVYGSTGCQATDKLCSAVQESIISINPLKLEEYINPGSLVFNISKSKTKEVEESYIKAVFDQSTGVDCSKLRVVYSPLCGTSLSFASTVLKKLNVTYSVVDSQMGDGGKFEYCPRPNPELDETMAVGAKQMLDEGADLFLANDPDGDRLGVVVHHANNSVKLSGDELGLLLFDFLCRIVPKHSRSVAFTTIVGTPLADQVAKSHNVELVRTLTGFKYIGEQIDNLEKAGELDRFLFAMEESLGYLRGGQTRDKDGILALMLVCECASWYLEQGRDLIDALEMLYHCYGYVASRQISWELPYWIESIDTKSVMRSLRLNQPRRIGNCIIREIVDYEMPLCSAKGSCDKTNTLPPSNVLEFRLCNSSKIIVRPSGTEPKIKCYIFANGVSANAARGCLNDLERGIRHIIDEIVVK